MPFILGGSRAKINDQPKRRTLVLFCPKRPIGSFVQSPRTHFSAFPNFDMHNALLACPRGSRFTRRRSAGRRRTLNYASHRLTRRWTLATTSWTRGGLLIDHRLTEGGLFHNRFMVFTAFFASAGNIRPNQLIRIHNAQKPNAPRTVGRRCFGVHAPKSARNSPVKAVCRGIGPGN
ncbi:hypothetical protein L596_011568 [Steinernema carpocapsae]|uniref:Uncharacterized protein n=1 Tax=Steinernema carpocapsae TaxID=34508 RepID=A0A4U5NUB6_STECR|nr:hypothetical protein L596_011568 [Steinernema carpocapsae]